ncbi:MAG TPA: YciI family protein [Actinomycetota bacterium]|nr:YciI family protein [Actinomycetota bacterium]
MRVMMFVKGDPKPGQLPSEKLVEEMGRFNEELAKAGVLVDGNGLRPSAEGARVVYSGGKRTVVDGPFAESKEIVAGYWMLQVKSLEEAIEWAKRVPFEAGEEYGEEAVIEIRPIFELDEFAQAYEDSPTVRRVVEMEKGLQKDLQQKK